MNQGDCYDLRQVEDEDEFIKTKTALAVSSMKQHLASTNIDIMADCPNAQFQYCTE